MPNPLPVPFDFSAVVAALEAIKAKAQQTRDTMKSPVKKKEEVKSTGQALKDDKNFQAWAKKNAAIYAKIEAKREAKMMGQAAKDDRLMFRQRIKARELSRARVERDEDEDVAQRAMAIISGRDSVKRPAQKPPFFWSEANAGALRSTQRNLGPASKNLRLKALRYTRWGAGTIAAAMRNPKTAMSLVLQKVVANAPVAIAAPLFAGIAAYRAASSAYNQISESVTREAQLEVWSALEQAQRNRYSSQISTMFEVDRKAMSAAEEYSNAAQSNLSFIGVKLRSLFGGSEVTDERERSAGNARRAWEGWRSLVQTDAQVGKMMDTFRGRARTEAEKIATNKLLGRTAGKWGEVSFFYDWTSPKAWVAKAHDTLDRIDGTRIYSNIESRKRFAKQLYGDQHLEQEILDATNAQLVSDAKTIQTKMDNDQKAGVLYIRDASKGFHAARELNTKKWLSTQLWPKAEVVLGENYNG